MNPDSFLQRSEHVSNLFNFRIAKTVERIRTTIGLSRNGYCEILGLSLERYELILKGRAEFDLVQLISLAEQIGISPNLIFSGKIDFGALASEFRTGYSSLPERYLVDGQKLCRVRTVSGIINFLDSTTRPGYTERILTRLQAKVGHFGQPDEFVSPLFVEDFLHELQVDGFEEHEIQKMGVASFWVNRHTKMGEMLSHQPNWKELYRTVIEELIGNFDQIWTYRLGALTDDHCVIEVMPKAEIHDIFHSHTIGTRLMCLCRQGVAISLSGFLGQNFAELTELSCMYRGDSKCTYRVSWAGLPPWVRPPVSSPRLRLI